MIKNLYGLVGQKLKHTFSKIYFDEKFRKLKLDFTYYRNYQLETIDEFPRFLREHPDVSGLNITFPYKESVMQYCDEITEEAKKIGAVNCIQFKLKKKIGHNTDVIGFRESFKPLLKKHHDKALVLGTGGANKSVVYVLNELNIDFKNVSLHPLENEFGYADLNKEVIKEYSIIINTSPIGMAPHDYLFPQIPYEFLSSKHLLFDLIYNPADTIFLQRGKEKGATTQNGISMLKRQAEESWEIWNQK